METQFDYSEMAEILKGLLLDIYRCYLEIDDPSQMRFDYRILAEEGDDLDGFYAQYELPVHGELCIRE